MGGGGGGGRRGGARAAVAAAAVRAKISIGIPKLPRSDESIFGRGRYAEHTGNRGRQRCGRGKFSIDKAQGDGS